MNSDWPREGIVYTETVVHTPPERYVSDAPYQLAIIESADGKRFTVRIVLDSLVDRIRIGERAGFIEERGGVAYYSRARN
jgi:uncharacterized OB-fold protein